MSRSRKTIEVAKVVEEVNYLLANTTVVPEIRQGMINLCEKILMDTNNYHGFRYLNVGEVPVGHAPGVFMKLEADGMPKFNFENTDSTRISFYL